MFGLISGSFWPGVEQDPGPDFPPETPALVNGQGQVLSRAELSQLVRGVLAELPPVQAPGPEGRRPWALVCNRGALPYLLAALELGQGLLLLHPRHSPSLWAQFAERAGASHLLLPTDQWLGLGKSTHQLDCRALSPQSPGRLQGDEALILATSGSSGPPKLAVLGARALWASAQASGERLGWQAADRWHLSLPLAHVGGLSVVLRCLWSGHACVLGEARSEPTPAFQAELEASSATLLSLVPTQLARLLAAPQFRLPSSLRLLLIGGAALSPHLRAQAKKRAWPVVCTYGLTEFCSQVATEAPEAALTSPELDNVGRPLPGVRLRLGPEARIELQGPMQLSRYLDSPTPLTADGYFPTGDRGELLSDGRLRVLGRLDSVLITGGEKLSPEQVEACLLQLPELQEICALGLEDPEWGQRLVVAVSLSSQHPASHPGPERQDWEQSCRALLAQQLSRWAQPKNFYYFAQLPHLASGKLDRPRLLELCKQQPRP